MEVIWSTQAEQDLAAIIDFIAKDNIDAALEMDLLLQVAAEGLIPFPRKGKPGRVPGIREIMVHDNYILVYSLMNEGIYIVSVLHAARQWPKI